MLIAKAECLAFALENPRPEVRFVEKLRISVDNLARTEAPRYPFVESSFPYACAPKRTDTSFETPGSCIVTP